MTDQHKHCPMCSKPIPLSEKFCSPKCEQIYMENQRKVAKSAKIALHCICSVHNYMDFLHSKG